MDLPLKKSESSDSRRLESLGERMQTARKAAGLTQRELAEKIKVQLRTINKFEHGQINIPVLTLFRIREALNCSWEDLMGP